MNAGRTAPRWAAAFLLAAFWGWIPIYAQVSYDTATLSGTIYDPSGSAVAGAAVTITNTATGVTRTLQSADTGIYRAPALSPGVYEIRVEAGGFRKAVVENIALTVGQDVPFDIHLMLGSISEVIEVTDRPPLIEPEQTQQANTVDLRQVENLPIVSRSFTDLIYTAPGVASSNAPSVQDPNIGTGFLASGFSIGGSNGRNNLITIDGGEDDYGTGAPRVRNVPMDSVQEFQINRNSFGAEFGNTVGTAINVVTRSGSNAFHGSVYSYLHNEHVDSVNYFNRLINPGVKPFEQSVISGVTMLGPVKKNKLFFFTAYENQKLDFATSQKFSGTAEFQPITAQTNGYSGGKCPGQPAQVTQLCYLSQLANSGTPLAPLGAGLLASSIFGPPLSHPILNALISPNEGTFDGIISTLGAQRGIPGFNTPRGRYNNWVSRIDHLPTLKDSLMLRLSLMNESDNVAPQPPTSAFDHQTDYTITSSWTHSYSPALVNVLRIQAVPYNTSSDEAPGSGSEIDLETANSIVLGTPFAFPYKASFKRFQFDDSIVLFRGRHTFKIGGSYRPDYYSVRQQLWFGGQWQFADGAIPLSALAPSATQSALAAYNLSQGYPAGGPPSTNLTAVQAFIAGTPLSLLQTNPSSNARWSDWDHQLGFYAQDTWKASRKLTMNYGLRLDYHPAPAPVPHSTYVSPRIGFAWDPAGSGKTIIRAGSGLYVAPVLFLVPFYVNLLGYSGKYLNQQALSAGLPSPPFPSIFAASAAASAKATVANPNPTLTPTDLASLGWAINAPGPNSFGSVFSTLQPNFKPQYSIQASASVAREISPDLSLEVGYNLYRTVHIQQVNEGNFERASCNVVNPGEYTNSIDPFVGPCYSARPGTTAGVPNHLVFQNNVFSSIGSGIYHGLTVSLTKRYVHSLQFQANYTLSRAEDNTSDYSTLSVPFRPDQLDRDWSVSNFNVTHTFIANAVYTSPFRRGNGLWSSAFADVNVSSIFSAHSGIPFTLLTPGIGGIGGNGTIGHTNEARPWNEPRNAGRGDSFASLDVRVSKALRAGENNRRLNLIVQIQNLLNQTNFAAVNNILPANPTFALPNGGSLLTGPYNVRGFAPTSVAQLGQPLAFTSAYPPRYVSLGLQFGF